jgi:hypothetical protein
MAERRMFAKTIIDSDAFLDMPMSARLLYYDFGMRADDDGFVNSPKKIMRMIGASDDDAKILVSKKFIIPFDSGLIVIKHWRINNYLRNDRYTQTKYLSEKSQLLLDENDAYKLPNNDVGIPVVSQLVGKVDTQVRLGKVRLGNSRDTATATRLPADWQPNEIEIQFCKSERPDLNVNEVKNNFIDYWIAIGGAKGRKLDWSATWRNWVRNERSNFVKKENVQTSGVVI